MIGDNCMKYKSKSKNLADKFDHLFFDIVDSSPLSVVITDEFHKIEYVNYFFSATTGYEYDEIVGRTPRLLKSGLTPDYVYQDFYKCLKEKGKWSGEFINIKKNGDIYTESSTIFTIVDKLEKKYYVAFKQDITERTKLMENVYLDSTTNLYNRRYLDEQLSPAVVNALDTKQPLSVIFIDLDYFKEINDQYGHSAGDKIISSISIILKTCISEDKDWIARFGGDEFFICLPNKNIDKARYIAKKIRRAIEKEKFEIDTTTVLLTCSMGIEVVDGLNGIESANQLFEIADKKLYSAKHLGKNQIMY